MTKNTTSITKYRKPFIFKDNPASLKIVNLNHLTTHKRLCNINIYSDSKESKPRIDAPDEEGENPGRRGGGKTARP